MTQKVLLVCDSRGRGLDDYLNHEITGMNWKIRICPGRGIQELINTAMNETSIDDFHAILIAGGICNITRRDVIGERISVRTSEMSVLVNSVFSEITEDLIRLRQRSKVTLLASTYGLDLPRYNRAIYGRYSNYNHEVDQRKLEHTVDMFNKKVSDCNRENGVLTVRLGNKIHHISKGGKIKTSYERLWDGCHPDDIMIGQNAEEILKVVTRALW